MVPAAPRSAPRRPKRANGVKTIQKCYVTHGVEAGKPRAKIRDTPATYSTPRRFSRPLLRHNGYAKSAVRSLWRLAADGTAIGRQVIRARFPPIPPDCPPRLPDRTARPRDRPASAKWTRLFRRKANGSLKFGRKFDLKKRLRPSVSPAPGPPACRGCSSRAPPAPRARRCPEPAARRCVKPRRPTRINPLQNPKESPAPADNHAIRER